MNISKALKEKNLLAGKLRRAKIDLEESSTWITGYGSIQAFKDNLQHYHDLSKQILTLKMKIHAASVSIMPKILLLAELKSEAEIVRSFSTSTGPKVSYRTSISDSAVYESALDISTKRDMLNAIESQISEIQDEIDAYNASTQV